MATAGLYRRALPSPPAIEFSSPEGKQLFVEGLQGGNMEGFFKLISYYQTQSEPAYCGLATLSMVLNALAIDPGRKWKGPWRWFDDYMLDCCEPLAKIQAEGITFGKVSCLAQCNGAKVETFRSNETTINGFRSHVISSTSSEDCHVITSYHRGVLKQTGSGHFSPIGGYHAGRDMVLILDVARFKYPPHWVPLTLLWEAMKSIDEATGHPRGYMIISRLGKSPSILYTLNCRNKSWNIVAKYLVEDVPQLLKSEDVKDIHKLLSVVYKSAPTDITEFIKWIAEVRTQEDGSFTISEEEKARVAIKEQVLKELQTTELHKHVMGWLSSEMLSSGEKDILPEIAAEVCSQILGGCMETKVKHVNGDGVTIAYTEQGGVHMLVPSKTDPSTGDALTILFLALPEHTWSAISQLQLRTQISSLVSSDNLPHLLQEEVLNLRRQLHFLTTDLCSSTSCYQKIPST